MLGDRAREYARRCPAQERIFQALLAVGGLEVARQRLDRTELARLGTRAVVFDAAACRVAKGENGRCHEEAFDQWESRLGTSTPLRLVTGWALGDQNGDGIWRAHSWTLDQKDRVVEPTRIRRDAYVGVILTTREALRGAW